MITSRLRLTCCIVLCLLVAATSLCLSAPLQDDLKAAYAELDKGNIDLAKTLLAQIVTEAPESPQAAEATWKLGYIAIKQKDVALAETHFQRVADAFPSSPKAPDALLRVAYLASKGKRPDTYNAFLEVTRRYPDTSEAQLAKFRLARLQVGQEDLDQALGNFAAVKDNSKTASAVKAEAAVLGAIAQVQKWYKTADIAFLEKAMTDLEGVEKDYPLETKQVAWSRIRLAQWYIYQGKNVGDDRFRNNPAKGRQILEDALRTLPENYFTWWMMAEVTASYITEKRFADVVTECQGILAKKPPASWEVYILYVMADSQARIGQTTEALATYTSLAKKYPKNDWGKDAVVRAAELRQDLGVTQ